jgi:hypothetical protein
MKNITVIFLLLFSNCFAQTKYLIGLSYSHLWHHPLEMNSSLTDYSMLTEQSSYGLHCMLLLDDSPISFHQEISLSPEKWTHHKFIDARYNYYTLYSAQYWSDSWTFGKCTNIDFTSYVMFCTKKEPVKFFAAPCVDIKCHTLTSSITYDTYVYQHHDSSNAIYVRDSTITYANPTQTTGFEKMSVYVGIQTGLIFKLKQGFYLTVTGKAMHTKKDLLVPFISNGYILSADIGLHYALHSKNKSKSPPNPTP